MDAEVAKRALDNFEEVVSLDVDDREMFLRRACADDFRLRQEYVEADRVVRSLEENDELTPTLRQEALHAVLHRVTALQMDSHTGALMPNNVRVFRHPLE
jgi:hypothetical protein